ncbi:MULTISPECIES: SMODS domain-containing nucleotidyltransferase [Gordonibacter]|uniref:Nucleotidyltransferase n=1 Tax=Gordonibacter faecis TaxID=3047475 RepID=A0ABT7DMU9_9ACTN|nr:MULTISPECIES: hypothetical protein [unclassified Gordonibacter]MDJ1649891.1 hypothetical protein [Gordonibacter sp. KGMB12511]
MTSIPHMRSYFDDFLKEIRLTDDQRSALIEAHERLRESLKKSDDLREAIVSTFLQGSYRRSTIIKPAAGQSSDVDVVVVTNIKEDEYTPSQALDMFVEFLEENYSGRYERQGRSWGIHLDDADIDLVPTSAPSEAFSRSEATKNALFSSLDVEALVNSGTTVDLYGSRTMEGINRILSSDDWKNEPLRIPNREAQIWEDTDPLSQISWTIEKNASCSGHYVNVVKAIKWWWRTKHPDKKYPKGYPLEHLIGNCCPDGIESVAEGVTLTFESIVALGSTKPILPDRGLPNDVMSSVSQSDYAKFYDAIVEAASFARMAFDAENTYEASTKWNELFGEEFPLAPEPESKAKFTARAGAATTLGEARFS